MIKIIKFGGGNLEVRRGSEKLFVKYHFDGKFAGYWTIAKDEDAKIVVRVEETKIDAIGQIKYGAV